MRISCHGDLTGRGIRANASAMEIGNLVDKVRGRNNDGVGLGLSICADIVKIHHTRIELKSREHEETRIKIIFPCCKHETIPD